MQSLSELLSNLLKFRNIPLDYLEGAGDAVVVTRTLFPKLQSLVTALKSVHLVVLAIVRVLDFIHLDLLKDRLWPRHQIPPVARRLTVLESEVQCHLVRRA